jgi:hypothetical protein
MHSGWGVLVSVTANGNALEVLERRRIVVTDPKSPGANQPYHYAANLEFPESEKFIANSATVSERLAQAAAEEVVRELSARHYRIAGAAVLLASGRPLPLLPKILASHPLIHTAEGEFFRHAVTSACETLGIPVTATRERDLTEQANAALGNASRQILSCISGMGSSLGPPWTADHKSAALAASMILHSKRRVAQRR